MTVRSDFFFLSFRQHFSSLHLLTRNSLPTAEAAEQSLAVYLRFHFLMANYGVESQHKSFLALLVSHISKGSIYGGKESVFRSAIISCQNGILQLRCQCINNHSLEAGWFHAGNRTSSCMTSGSISASL